MSKATTVTVERSSTARIPLERRLNEEEFESIREAAEAVNGVERIKLDTNAQVMCVDIAPAHTGTSKTAVVLKAVAKIAGIEKITIVPVV